MWIKIAGSNFVLSDAQSMTSGTLNRGGIDLSFLRTVCLIHQILQKLIFLEIIDTLVTWHKQVWKIQDHVGNDYYSIITQP